MPRLVPVQQCLPLDAGRPAALVSRLVGELLGPAGAASGWIIHENNGNSFHAYDYEQRDGTIKATARYRSVAGAEGNKIIRYGEPKTYVWPVATVKIREVN